MVFSGFCFCVRSFKIKTYSNDSHRLFIARTDCTGHLSDNKTFGTPTHRPLLPSARLCAECSFTPAVDARTGRTRILVSCTSHQSSKKNTAKKHISQLMKSFLKNFFGRLLWRQDKSTSSSSFLSTNSKASQHGNKKGQKGSSKGWQNSPPEEADAHKVNFTPAKSQSGRDTPPGSGIKDQNTPHNLNDDENPSSHFLGGHAAKDSVRSVHQHQKECRFRKHDTFELTQKGATAAVNSYRVHAPLEDQSSSILSSDYDDIEEYDSSNVRVSMDSKSSRQDAAILLSHRSHPSKYM